MSDDAERNLMAAFRDLIMHFDRRIAYLEIGYGTGYPGRDEDEGERGAPPRPPLRIVRE
jgi:hypothetical protein